MNDKIMMLTKAQKDVYHAIEAYIQEYGMSPTFRELGIIVGGKSHGTIHAIVRKLIAHGVITKHDKTARSLKLASVENLSYIGTCYIPVLKQLNYSNYGRLLDMYNIRCHIPLPITAFTDPKNTFVISVLDSNLKQHVLLQNTDMLIIEKTDDIAVGDIVMALYKTSTIIRYCRADDSNRLELIADAAKPRYYVDDKYINIIGKVIGNYNLYNTPHTIVPVS